jgi:hypothetical protein
MTKQVGGETPQKTRPEIVTDRHLKYLDGLRKSGKTNMFGAPAYLQRQFGIEKENAFIITQYWMDSFGNPNR